jgi:membrane-bound lytic murein transglycosylase A
MKIAFQQNPSRVQELMHANESYVFFQQYPEGNWPAGSLGFPVTTERSLATDKSVYPRGGLVLVDTDTLTMTGTKKRFNRFMLDQDTGGAIRAPGRADIFMGIGPTAEIVAGGQYAEGRLYYFFVKPEYIDLYAPQARTASPRQ